jgi:ElaB/YqjD/DUF883 family membrane-anchored ribosome-binding protein
MAEKSDVQQELAQLKKDLSQVQSDMADLASALREAGVGKAHDVKDSVEDEISARREELRRLINEARASGRRVMGDTVEGIEETVGDHPVSSLLTAFGFGFVIARLMAQGDRR